MVLELALENGRRNNNYNHNAIEYCLAHKVFTPVQAAYMRSDLFDQRIKIMEDWNKFIMH